MERPLAIWVTGTPVSPAEQARGSFADMIQQAIGEAYTGPYQLVFCEEEAVVFPQPSEVCGVVITGSPAHVADRLPWILRTEEALRTYRGSCVPVLGICFGHQLLGQAWGGEVGPHPRGREIGVVPVEKLQEDELLLEVESSFPAVMTHLDSVLRLPPGAQILARTAHEPHAALRFDERTWGLQFHPEMDPEIISYYIQVRTPELLQEGFKPEQLLAELVPTPGSRGILQRFARLCQAK